MASSNAGGVKGIFVVPVNYGFGVYHWMPKK
jgi:hypothetical protein